MYIVICPKCDNLVGAETKACPQCGTDLTNEPTRSRWRSLWIGLLAGLVMLAIAAVVYTLVIKQPVQVTRDITEPLVGVWVLQTAENTPETEGTRVQFNADNTFKMSLPGNPKIELGGTWEATNKQIELVVTESSNEAAVAIGTTTTTFILEVTEDSLRIQEESAAVEQYMRVR